MVGPVIMQVTYGFDTEREGDAYIQIAERALRAYSAAANAGVYLVDTIPACMIHSPLRLCKFTISCSSEVPPGVVPWGWISSSCKGMEVCRFSLAE